VWTLGNLADPCTARTDQAGSWGGQVEFTASAEGDLVELIDFHARKRGAALPKSIPST